MKKPQYDDALIFTEGLAAVELDGKWGATSTRPAKGLMPSAKYTLDKES